MKVGVYRIVNKINGKVYVGQSRNIIHRLNQHKVLLKKGKHPNDYLQKAWNKYKEDSFIFEILEECSINILTDREEYWVNFYGGINSENNYNLRYPDEHKPLSESTKKKISESQKRRNLKGKNNPMYGKKHTKETKQKISEKQKLLQKGQGNGMYGKHHKNSTKQLISKANKGKKLSQETKQAISAWCKEQWKIWKNDPIIMEHHRQASINCRKYNDKKRLEIYETFKKLNSRKATSKLLNIPLESCRIIINQMIEQQNKGKIG